jgi:hypothetical protein
MAEVDGALKRSGGALLPGGRGETPFGVFSKGRYSED